MTTAVTIASRQCGNREHVDWLKIKPSNCARVRQSRRRLAAPLGDTCAEPHANEVYAEFKAIRPAN